MIINTYYQQKDYTLGSETYKSKKESKQHTTFQTRNT